MTDNRRKQPFTLEEFKSIYSRVPRATVDLVIKTDQGTLLTLRQSNGWLNQWHLPGGTILYRERIADAIQRIADEELNIKVKIDGLIDYIEFLSEEKERGYGYSVSLVFLCTPTEVIPSHTDKYTFFKTLPENIIHEHKEVLVRHAQ